MRYPDEFDDLFAYWHASPPANELLAAYLGIEQRPRVGKRASSEEELLAFARAIGAG